MTGPVPGNPLLRGPINAGIEPAHRMVLSKIQCGTNHWRLHSPQPRIDMRYFFLRGFFLTSLSFAIARFIYDLIIAMPLALLTTHDL